MAPSLIADHLSDDQILHNLSSQSNKNDARIVHAARHIHRYTGQWPNALLADCPPQSWSTYVIETLAFLVHYYNNEMVLNHLHMLASSRSEINPWLKLEDLKAAKAHFSGTLKWSDPPDTSKSANLGLSPHKRRGEPREAVGLDKRRRIDLEGQSEDMDGSDPSLTNGMIEVGSRRGQGQENVNDAFTADTTRRTETGTADANEANITVSHDMGTTDQALNETPANSTVDATIEFSMPQNPNSCSVSAQQNRPSTENMLPQVEAKLAELNNLYKATADTIGKPQVEMGRISQEREYWDAIKHMLTVGPSGLSVCGIRKILTEVSGDGEKDQTAEDKTRLE